MFGVPLDMWPNTRESFGVVRRACVTSKLRSLGVRHFGLFEQKVWLDELQHESSVVIGDVLASILQQCVG